MHHINKGGGERKRNENRIESPLTKNVDFFFFCLFVPLIYAAVKGGGENRKLLISFEI